MAFDLGGKRARFKDQFEVDQAKKIYPDQPDESEKKEEKRL